MDRGGEVVGGAADAGDRLWIGERGRDGRDVVGPNHDRWRRAVIDADCAVIDRFHAVTDGSPAN